MAAKKSAVVKKTAAVKKKSVAKKPEAIIEEPIVSGAEMSSDVRILLPANMEITGLDSSFSLLRGHYPPKSKKCILDGADINAIDASGIQLLINFVQSVKQKGCDIEWDNYSIQAYQLADELGLAEQLGD